MLSVLLDEKQPITVNELSKKVDRSGRTVRNYLDDIEKILDKDNIKLIRKTNVGVYIEAENSKRQKLKENLFSIEYNDEAFSSEYRQKYILKTLLESKFSYTIQLFSEELYCSKSTIASDLAEVQKILESKNLVLQRRQNQGLWVEGKEKDYRNAIKEFLYEVKEKDTLEINNFDIEKLDYRIDFINYKNIKSMFPWIDILYIQGIIQEAEMKLGFYFTEQAFINLIVHITIAIERIKSKKYIQTDMGICKDIALKNVNEYKTANWIVTKLQEKYKIKFPEKEISYITIHILGGKIQENNGNKDMNLLESTCDDQILRIAKEIMKLSSDILGVDITNDKNLLTSLILHLRPTIIRLKYGLTLNNPMLEAIKKDYTSIFGAVWACNGIFEKELGISINEDEVGYITIHIGLAYERAKEKVKVIVVCSSGIGTSQLVALKLENRFKNMEITNVIPLNLVTEDMIENSDLIISTVRIMKNSEKILYISAILSENDFKCIEKALERFNYQPILNHKENNKNRILNNYDLFDEELVFTEDTHDKFEDVLRYYGKIIEKKGYAKNGFTQDLFKREKKASTYLGKGLTIPHSSQSYVNKSKISFIRFKKPIFWNNNEIKIAIILCLNFKNIHETRNFFKKIYSILQDDEIMKSLYFENDKRKIIDILR
ncbi:BglG family transcription antiterminator [Haloimpatiens sp. FM7315]|uniref:BglG family transcription antiterminator n=1 Tax=Haloimpatiens sp. FM7315 TaxID=3298609 RepID=UPI00370CB57C